MSAVQNLSKLSRAELEAYAARLEQLLGLKRSSSRNKNSAREINFKEYGVRKIALKLAYQGWSFPSGFAAQPADFSTSSAGKLSGIAFKSVESALFYALEKVNLVPNLHWFVGSDGTCATGVSPNRPLSREKFGETWAVKGWQYARGGRTDKGVSAIGQVVSLLVRCPPPGTGTNFYDYIHLLNRELPASVRVYAWAPVADDFSARFSAYSRTYKYFVPNVFSDEGICSMVAAAKKMVGRHDFANFCKFDAETTKGNTERVILQCTVELAKDEFYRALFPRGILEFTIEGQAFLYHQVRFMIALLLEIGRGTENISLVDSLLGLDGSPRIDPRPQYVQAPEHPLVLWNIHYGENELPWRYALERDSPWGKCSRNSTVVGILRPILLQWYADLTKVIFNGALLRRTTHGSPFCKDEGSEAANEPCAGLAPLMFTHMVDADVHVPIEKRSSSGLNAEQRIQKVRRLLDRQ